MRACVNAVGLATRSCFHAPSPPRSTPRFSRHFPREKVLVAVVPAATIVFAIPPLPRDPAHFVGRVTRAAAHEVTARGLHNRGLAVRARLNYRVVAAHHLWWVVSGEW